MLQLKQTYEPDGFHQSEAPPQTAVDEGWTFGDDSDLLESEAGAITPEANAKQSTYRIPAPPAKHRAQTDSLEAARASYPSLEYSSRAQSQVRPAQFGQAQLSIDDLRNDQAAALTPQKSGVVRDAFHRRVSRFSVTTLAPIALTLSAVLLFALTVAGNHGLLQLHKLNNELIDLQSKNRKLEWEIMKVQSDTTALQDNEPFLEKKAREELGLAGPNETIYFFEHSHKN